MTLGPPSPLSHAISSSGAVVGEISRGQGDMRHLRQINLCPGPPVQALVFDLWYPLNDPASKESAEDTRCPAGQGQKLGRHRLAGPGSHRDFPGGQPPAEGAFNLVANKQKLLKNCNEKIVSPYPSLQILFVILQNS